MADEHKLRRGRLTTNNRSKIDLMLDKLEHDINNLRIQYEQYFLNINPQAPEELHKSVKIYIRNMLKQPFKNASNRFRLRTLIARYQTHDTYWEKIKKQRENGAYTRDVFKADLRERETNELRERHTHEGCAEHGMKQLFDVYTSAIKNLGSDVTGKRAEQPSFESFKKSLISMAKTIKDKHGVSSLNYKIVLKDGKVIIKASPKAPTPNLGQKGAPEHKL